MTKPETAVKLSQTMLSEISTSQQKTSSTKTSVCDPSPGSPTSKTRLKQTFQESMTTIKMRKITTISSLSTKSKIRESRLKRRPPTTKKNLESKRLLKTRKLSRSEGAVYDYNHRYFIRNTLIYNNL